jgi:hypothetical protein
MAGSSPAMTAVRVGGVVVDHNPSTALVMMLR